MSTEIPDTLPSFDDAVQKFLSAQGLDNTKLLVAIDAAGTPTLFKSADAGSKRLADADFDSGSISGKIRKSYASSAMVYGEGTCILYQTIINGQLVIYEICY